MKTASRILHFDADNFFASCEEILSPALRGRPLIVAGGRRNDGIVLSASRRAKAFGIKSGMGLRNRQPRTRCLFVVLAISNSRRPGVRRPVQTRFIAGLYHISKASRLPPRQSLGPR